MPRGLLQSGRGVVRPVSAEGPPRGGSAQTASGTGRCPRSPGPASARRAAWTRPPPRPRGRWPTAATARSPSVTRKVLRRPDRPSAPGRPTVPRLHSTHGPTSPGDRSGMRTKYVAGPGPTQDDVRVGDGRNLVTRGSLVVHNQNQERPARLELQAEFCEPLQLAALSGGPGTRRSPTRGRSSRSPTSNQTLTTKAPGTAGAFVVSGGAGNRTRVRRCLSGSSPGAVTLLWSQPPRFV